MSDNLVPRMTFTEKAATSMTLLVYARLAMIVLAFVMPIATGLGGMMLTRALNTLDKTAEKQEQMGRDFAKLQEQVLHVVSDQVQNSKNIQDRIESGERTLNDRINAQGTWLQQVAEDVKDLVKKVYSMNGNAPKGGGPR